MPDNGPYDIGDRPIITATFADVEGGTGVSTACTFTVRRPNGTENTYTSDDAEVAPGDEENVWILTMPRLDVDGPWWIRAESTVGLQAAREIPFKVRESNFTAP